MKRPKLTKRPTYAAAVYWIALNDEPGENDLTHIEQLISTALVADLFGADEQRVAVDVQRVRAGSTHLGPSIDADPYAAFRMDAADNEAA